MCVISLRSSLLSLYLYNPSKVYLIINYFTMVDYKQVNKILTSELELEPYNCMICQSIVEGVPIRLKECQHLYCKGCI